jgi:hypothetical protein
VSRRERRANGAREPRLARRVRSGDAPSRLPVRLPNFIDRTQPDWEHAYYGANLERLMKVKRAYDPDDVFSYKQSVPLG